MTNILYEFDKSCVAFTFLISFCYYETIFWYFSSNLAAQQIMLNMNVFPKNVTSYQLYL